MRTLMIVVAAIGLQTVAAGAQTAAPAPRPAVPEHYGFGAVTGVGWPGPFVALRFSAPIQSRFAVDFDAGRARESDRATMMLAGQVRWLRRHRQNSRHSDYGIFGASVMQATNRTEIRFPDRTILTVERTTRITPQVGYGLDWQGRHGTRIGVEAVTGGSESAGPRIFAKVFVVWGPAAHAVSGAARSSAARRPQYVSDHASRNVRRSRT